MLLYCMTEAESAAGLLPPGVREAAVESLAGGGVRCFYSRVEGLSANAEAFRADALRFHAVLRQILVRAARHQPIAASPQAMEAALEMADLGLERLGYAAATYLVHMNKNQSK